MQTVVADILSQFVVQGSKINLLLVSLYRWFAVAVARGIYIPVNCCRICVDRSMSLVAIWRSCLPLLMFRSRGWQLSLLLEDILKNGRWNLESFLRRQLWIVQLIEMFYSFFLYAFWILSDDLRYTPNCFLMLIKLSILYSFCNLCSFSNASPSNTTGAHTDPDPHVQLMNDICSPLWF